MTSAVIVFPGSNCDRDAAVALERLTGQTPLMVWHEETALPANLDLVVLPGGFSYGDYLRCGAMAGRAGIMAEVKSHAERGGAVIGICNGFQMLTEIGLLPGALLRNAGLNFICKPQALEIANPATRFTAAYRDRRTVTLPIAHHDGNYFADATTLDRLEGEGQVAFRYAGNPNGSARDIAGITNARGNVLGLMPHPERACDSALGSVDGRGVFESVLAA
ncbi:MAG: phosphoribosylformylglycinamidine synthase subunit PurQ [Maricaulaceae bacterium]